MLITSLVVVSALVASLLAVLGLVASLGASIGVLLHIALLAIPWLGKGVRRRLLLLGRLGICAGEGSQPASLLEHKPQVSSPQDQVNKSKGLWNGSRGLGSWSA